MVECYVIKNEVVICRAQIEVPIKLRFYDAIRDAEINRPTWL